MSLRRLRVRPIDKDYTDTGPDLLRGRGNAVHQLGSQFGAARTGFFIRRNPVGEDTPWGNWTGPFSRAGTLKKATTWAKNAGGGAKFQVGRKVSRKMEPRHEMLMCSIPHTDLQGTNAGAELVADLARFQFDVNVGGFSCREYNGIPGSGWSDHAWGDAVDLVGGSNDRLTDWCVRMARAGLMGSPDQFIGSKSGRVYSFVEPAYAPNLGGPSSHLSHVHCSYIQHYGANPRCS